MSPDESNTNKIYYSAVVGGTKIRKRGRRASATLSKTDIKNGKWVQVSRCRRALHFCKYNTSTAPFQNNQSNSLIPYLLKVAHSPPCPWPNAAFFQASVTLLSASSRSWTLEAWEPGGGSSWPGSGSSSRHSETLQRNSSSTTAWVYPLVATATVGVELHIVKHRGVLHFSPRYSNSSFRAMPLWEKHCWQMRAYLEETTRIIWNTSKCLYPPPPPQ